MKKRCFCCNKAFFAARSDQLFCCPSCRYQYYHNGPLILPIKKQWFDMILAGIKKEEYRERKEYWKKRFVRYFGYGYSELPDGSFGWRFLPGTKEVIFRNGYKKNAPEITALVSISEKEGNPEWVAKEGEIYYTLKIAQIISKQNIQESK